MRSESVTNIFRSWAANENQSQTHATLHGATRHFVGTPITWRRSSSKKESSDCSTLLVKERRLGQPPKQNMTSGKPSLLGRSRSCVQKQSGGVAIGRLSRITSKRAGWKCCTFSAQTKSIHIRTHRLRGL